MNRRSIHDLLLACLVSFLIPFVAGCGGSSDDDSSNRGDGTKAYKIMLIPKGTTHAFWKMVEAGAHKAAKEYNDSGKVRVAINWKGPLKEDDTQDQINLVKTSVSLKVDGLCLAPLDKGALVDPVREFGRSKVPVLVFDSGLDAEVGKDFISYVATDNYKGGVHGAERLGEVMEGKGKAILLRYMVGSDSTMQREKGFLDTMAEKFPDIELISTDQYADATEEKAFERSQNVLTRFEKDVEGIFCPNESSASGMLDALRQRGLAGKVKFVGFDASEKLVAALAKSELDGLVLQNPVKMGYESVRTMVRHLEGETVEARVDTGVTVATPENMNTPEMKELHSPDLSKWTSQ